MGAERPGLPRPGRSQGLTEVFPLPKAKRAGVLPDSSGIFLPLDQASGEAPGAGSRREGAIGWAFGGGRGQGNLVAGTQGWEAGSDPCVAPGGRKNGR